MLRKSIVLPMIITGIFFNGCNDSKKETKIVEKKSKIEQKKPLKTINPNEFKLTTTDNEKIVILKKDKGYILKDNPNKIIIFDIFATWCPPCRAEAKVLSNLENKYKKDVKIIGITIEEGIENSKLKEFAKSSNATYLLVNSKENKRLIDDIVKKLNIGKRFPIPLMVMYKDGKILNYYLGATEEEFIESDIKKALGK